MTWFPLTCHYHGCGGTVHSTIHVRKDAPEAWVAATYDAAVCQRKRKRENGGTSHTEAAKQLPPLDSFAAELGKRTRGISALKCRVHWELRADAAQSAKPHLALHEGHAGVGRPQVNADDFIARWPPCRRRGAASAEASSSQRALDKRGSCLFAIDATAAAAGCRKSLGCGLWALPGGC